MNEILSWGRETLEIESEALRESASRLDDSFVKAVNLVKSISGKVVTTGLGKSGHIARKISATLASTGTPAFFMHPAEALHGDSGMLASGDVLFAIAFGGETREVIEVAKFARRTGVPVLALTGKQPSTLAELADIVLDGSVTREACPLNLAPTSSTTVALAIGDALSVALMKARGFQEADFARFHPDGALGRKLSLVMQHMHPVAQLPLLKKEDGFKSVLEKITQNNFGIAAIVDQNGNLEGAITDGDLRRAIIKHEAKVFALAAKDIMTSKPRTIPHHVFAVDAVRSMEDSKITALFVVEDASSRRLVGLVRMHDLLAAKII